MGLCFMDLLMKEEASECFRTAVALDEGGIRAMALALLVHESRQACQWTHLAQETAARNAVQNAADSAATEVARLNAELQLLRGQSKGRTSASAETARR